MGRVTTACRRLASPSRPTRVARNFGFCARTVDLRPLMTLVKSLGRNLRAPQSEGWNGARTGKELNAASEVGSEPPPLTDPVVSSLPQLVGLIVNSLRLALTSIERMSSLAPPKTSGIWSE